MLSYLVSVSSHQVNASSAPFTVELGPVVWTGLNWTRNLGAPNVANVSCAVDTLDDSIKTRLRDLRATPCELNITRDTGTGTATTVHTGPITAWTINARTLTLVSPDCLYYLAYWHQITDLAYNGEEQAAIVRQLIDHQQAQPYGHRGLDTSTIAATGIYRDLTLAGAEARNVLDVVTEMGRRTNGYDLAATGRAITLTSPKAGTDLTAAVIIDARMIGTPLVAQSVAAGTAGTVGFATSSTDTGATTTATHSTSTLSTFGRAVVTQSFNGVKEQATLDEHAAVLARDASAPQWTISPTLVPVADMDATTVAPGDTVGYSFDAGLGLQETSLRVAQVVVSMNDPQGRETVQLGFV